jgi:hypothetical protein
MQKPDKIKARNEAVNLLLRQNLTSLRFDVLKFKFSFTIAFDTIENYCSQTRQRAQDLYSMSHDAMTFSSHGVHVVLYSSGIKNSRRRNFTLAHEIGHITLGHDVLGDHIEREADMFAAELLAPRALIRELSRIGYKITPDLLCDSFYISRSCAEARMNCLKYYYNISENERRLIEKCRPFLYDNDSHYLSY